jgi:plastocyanin
MKVALAFAGLAALAVLAGCASQPSPSAPVPTHTVTIPGQWLFEPSAIQIAAGTAVTWQNHGGQAHSVTFDDGSFDQVVPAGGTLARSFATPGTYAYHCKFHPPDMKGTIVVVAGETNATVNRTNVST